MKKGSSARRCHECGKIVMWAIPTGESVLGIRLMKAKCLECYGGNDGIGYICKECKERKEKGGR